MLAFIQPQIFSVHITSAGDPRPVVHGVSCRKNTLVGKWALVPDVYRLRRFAIHWGLVKSGGIMPKTHRAMALMVRTFSSAILIGLLCGSSLVGQKPAAEEPATSPGAPVQVQGRVLFVIQEGYFAFTPADRANAISARVLQLSKEPKSHIQAVRVADQETTTSILDGDVIIMTVTPQDAKAAGKTRQALAQEYAAKIQEAAASLQKQHSFRAVMVGVLWGVSATIALLLVFKLLSVLFKRAYSGIRSWHGKYIRTIRIQRLELLPAERITSIFLL